MTEETKHTPGPWVLAGNKPRRLHFGEDTRFWMILNKDGYSPAIVPPWDAVPPIAAEEAKANARLIAAAPELLEALEDLCDFGSECTQDKWDRAREAIAKAKGKP